MAGNSRMLNSLRRADFFNIKYSVTGIENIPIREIYFCFQSSPGRARRTGLIYELSKHFKELKFPVNDILTNITNLSGIFLPVNKHGRRVRQQKG